ncbi:MAG: hypothetical protein KF856_11205 [Cyclobacteriaceae bacterium]|nr:hypothetical protein [Cyclobacteriaceae bacterium]
MITSCNSKLLLHKLLTLMDNEVEVTLVNNVVLKGFLIGFFFGRQEFGDPFILKWHLVEKKDLYSFGSGILNTCIGTIFLHTELKSVRFLCDNSELVF